MCIKIIYVQPLSHKILIMFWTWPVRLQVNDIPAVHRHSTFMWTSQNRSLYLRLGIRKLNVDFWSTANLKGLREERVGHRDRWMAFMFNFLEKVLSLWSFNLSRGGRATFFHTRRWLDKSVRCFAKLLRRPGVSQAKICCAPRNVFSAFHCFPLKKKKIASSSDESTAAYNGQYMQKKH